jgi:hypothetical protein
MILAVSGGFTTRLLSAAAGVALEATGLWIGEGGGGGIDAPGLPVVPMASYRWTISEIDVLRVARGRGSDGGIRLLVVGVIVVVVEVEELSTDLEGKMNID